jgi:hypothetical protein
MLKPPPTQNVPGVILYHESPHLDAQIRKVRRLRDHGCDVQAIQEEIGKSRRSVFDYLHQIDLATKAYIVTFPEEFGAGIEGLILAVFKRRDLDRMLRRELTGLAEDSGYRFSIYRLILQNLRALEDLTGLRAVRILHQGVVTVKSDFQQALETVPKPLQDQYLDALASLIEGSEGASADSVSLLETELDH